MESSSSLSSPSSSPPTHEENHLLQENNYHTETLSIGPRTFLFDLNKGVSEFDISFEVRSKDPQKEFLVRILTQEQLNECQENMEDESFFRKTKGYISGKVKNTTERQSHFLALKAVEPLEVDVHVEFHTLPGDVMNQPEDDLQQEEAGVTMTWKETIISKWKAFRNHRFLFWGGMVFFFLAVFSYVGRSWISPYISSIPVLSWFVSSPSSSIRGKEKHVTFLDDDQNKLSYDTDDDGSTSSSVSSDSVHEKGRQEKEDDHLSTSSVSSATSGDNSEEEGSELYRPVQPRTSFSTSTKQSSLSPQELLKTVQAYCAKKKGGGTKET